MSLELCFYPYFVWKLEHGSALWRCTKSVGKDQGCAKHIATPRCPWVLNSGTSEGPLACPAYCVQELISALHCSRRSACPLHLPAAPKRMEPIGNVPGEISFVCLFFCLQVFLSFFCLLISCYFSPWPLLALTSFDFEVFFSSLKYIW